MKKRKSLSLKSENIEDMIDEFDYDRYCEFVENGYKDRDIARELNISESYLKSFKEEVKEDY